MAHKSIIAVGEDSGVFEVIAGQWRCHRAAIMLQSEVHQLQRASRRHQLRLRTNISTAATPITAVAIQPRTTIGRLEVKAPITLLFEASRMITTISGTATIPLITALQNRAFI